MPSIYYFCFILFDKCNNTLGRILESMYQNYDIYVWLEQDK